MWRVKVVIPVYKESLTYGEQISLRQVKKILGTYPIIFIAPNRMKNFFEKRNYDVEFFSDEYFYNVRTYSRLLLSLEFYRKFVDCDFILIYQLDGFVFSNRLLEFCDMNYDYIGAPVSQAGWPRMVGRVGNGGVSLRKIKSHYRMLSLIDPFMIMKQFPKRLGMSEDTFWAWCGSNEDIDFSVPDIRIASKFCMDTDVAHCYRNVCREMPFSCHAWERSDYKFWKNIIESFGYDLPSRLDDMTIPAKQIWIGEYLIRRLIRGEGKDVCEQMKKLLKPMYAIWGIGMDGENCLKFLELLGMDIPCIFDKSVKKGIFHDRSVDFPTKNKLDAYKNHLIIATTRYEREISNQLISIGWKRDMFITWKDIVYLTGKNYLQQHFRYV